MKPKTSFIEIAMLAIMTIGLLFWGSLPVEGSEKGAKPGKVRPVGIVTPDGDKSVWLVGDDMTAFLARHASQQIEGLKFYQFTTWKDTATFLIAVNEHQGRLIRDLVVDMKKLNKRVKRLERKTGSVTYYPVNHRLEALEKKVREMSDGGNP